jgi:hypothetical protein
LSYLDIGTYYAYCHRDYLRLKRTGDLLAIIQNEKGYLYDALNYVAKGKVKVIAKTFSLDDIRDEYEKSNQWKCAFSCGIKRMRKQDMSLKLPLYFSPISTNHN